jgi:hypothetical protein
MRGSQILLVLAATMAAATARADFVIASTPVTSGPIIENFPDNPPDEASTRSKLASGFGNQIPISLAVRQIVPSAVKVTCGPGAEHPSWSLQQGARGLCEAG